MGCVGSCVGVRHARFASGGAVIAAAGKGGGLPPEKLPVAVVGRRKEIVLQKDHDEEPLREE